MPLGHALLAVNSAQTGATPGLSGDFGSKLVFLAVETELKSTTKPNWTKEMIGRILSPRELLPDFTCQSLTRLLLSCRVVDGLCYNELGRLGQVFVSPEFRFALCKAKGQKCYGIFHLNGK